MYQGGETALQADCGEFDSHCLHKYKEITNYVEITKKMESMV